MPVQRWGELLLHQSRVCAPALQKKLGDRGEEWVGLGVMLLLLLLLLLADPV